MIEPITQEQIEKEELAISRMKRRVAAYLYAVKQHDVAGAREEVEAARQIYVSMGWIAKMICDGMLKRIGHIEEDLGKDEDDQTQENL